MIKTINELSTNQNKIIFTISSYENVSLTVYLKKRWFCRANHTKDSYYDMIFCKIIKRNNCTTVHNMIILPCNLCLRNHLSHYHFEHHARHLGLYFPNKNNNTKICYSLQFQQARSKLLTSYHIESIKFRYHLNKFVINFLLLSIQSIHSQHN